MEYPEHNLALDLVRVTEAAALAAARLLGREDREQSDRSAVRAMRREFGALEMDGSVVIGQGKGDSGLRFHKGERLGTGQGIKLDLAVMPVEGARLLAHGRPNALSLVAAAPAGSMFNPGSSYYMRKIVVPKEARDSVELDAPVEHNLKKVARALDKDVDDLTVFVLDRPRHFGLVDAVRKAGARIQLHADGDVNGALMTVDERGSVDIMMGIGGTSEGVLSACALRGMGGRMLCRLEPQYVDEAKRLLDEGLDTGDILTEEDLVKEQNVFFAATSISGGAFLKGVRYTGQGALVRSLAVRGKTGTARYVESRYAWEDESRSK